VNFEKSENDSVFHQNSNTNHLKNNDSSLLLKDLNKTIIEEKKNIIHDNKKRKEENQENKIIQKKNKINLDLDQNINERATVSTYNTSRKSDFSNFDYDSMIESNINITTNQNLESNETIAQKDSVIHQSLPKVSDSIFLKMNKFSNNNNKDNNNHINTLIKNPTSNNNNDKFNQTIILKNEKSNMKDFNDKNIFYKNTNIKDEQNANKTDTINLISSTNLINKKENLAKIININDNTILSRENTHNNSINNRASNASNNSDSSSINFTILDAQQANVSDSNSFLSKINNDTFCEAFIICGAALNNPITLLDSEKFPAFCGHEMCSSFEAYKPQIIYRYPIKDTQQLELNSLVN